MHHASQESENENKKSVVLAIVMIVALFTAIGVALMRAPEVRAARVDVHRVGHVEIPSSRAELVRGSRERRPGNPRLHWAQDRHRRLRAKGRTCAVRTRGELDRILVFSWTRENLDREHMEQLQRVEGLYDELRSLGFSKMVEEVDGKVIWSKNL
jgi:hypothetical protein